MKKKMFITGIIIFICLIYVATLFFIDDILQKNYNTETPSAGKYDVIIKSVDNDFIEYAKDVLSDEKMQEINDEYAKKVASGIFPNYSE